MERNVTIDGKEVSARYVLDKIRQYEFCLTSIPGNFKYNDTFVLEGFQTAGFQNYRDVIHIPDDVELIEQIIELIRTHCSEEIKIYEEALIK